MEAKLTMIQGTKDKIEFDLGINIGESTIIKAEDLVKAINKMKICKYHNIKVQAGLLKHEKENYIYIGFKNYE